jgi:protein-tyrosine-phosphatase
MDRRRTILLVCHANTCRSVIAAELLKRELARVGLDKRWEVLSGGIAPYARDGALVSLDARLVLRRKESKFLRTPCPPISNGIANSLPLPI